MTEAAKDDKTKIRWDLLPTDALAEIAKVLTAALKENGGKHDPDNWRADGGMNWRRVIGAMYRHLDAIQRGEDVDPEFGLSHAAHLGCEALFLLHYMMHPEAYHKDDRFKMPPLGGTLNTGERTLTGGALSPYTQWVTPIKGL